MYKEKQKSIVAFLDILGFKQLVGDPNNFKKIKEFLYEIRDFSTPYNANIEQIGERSYQGKVNPNISSFSDHVIISFPVISSDYSENATSEEVFGYHFLQMLHIISEIQLKGLQKDFLFRGGIAFGDMFYDHEKNIIFGEPLIHAIEAEERDALYPRVVLCKSFIEQSIKNEYFANRGSSRKPQKFPDSF